MKTLNKRPRVDELREQYFNSRMVKEYGTDLYCYYIKVGANLALYAKGWKEGQNSPTLLLRHAFAEKYVLENTKTRIYNGKSQ